MEHTGRKYYEAYDERYKAAHADGIRWIGDVRSAIVSETVSRYRIRRDEPILELGCGEGRDARVLLEQGYDLLATDVSPEAIRYCQALYPSYRSRFQVLDCVGGQLGGKYRLIYAVAVVHMLLLDEDRHGFYRFIHDHLAEDGVALICTMGDGTVERQSDIRAAFELQEREHAGGVIRVAATSCRMVGFDTFEKELASGGLAVLEQGLTSIPPEFSQMMYAVVKKASPQA